MSHRVEHIGEEIAPGASHAFAEISDLAAKALIVERLGE